MIFARSRVLMIYKMQGSFFPEDEGYQYMQLQRSMSIPQKW